MPTKKLKPEEKPQSERFIETAREIGADETEEGFEGAFERIVIKTAPPTVKEKKKPRI
jgi:hypothetical protein